MAPNMQLNGRTFTEMVGATMAALRGGYTKVATTEGRRSPTSTRHRNKEAALEALEEEEGLLDANIEMPTQKRRRFNCGLLLKVIGIVAALFLVISLGKLILKPSSTGLEGMPVFSESLGCLNAAHLYNGGETAISVPVGGRNDHSIDVRGHAVGTFTVTEAPADITQVQYKITIQSNDLTLLDQVGISYPPAGPDGNSDGVSRLIIGTPRDTSESCVRYDVIMYVPKNLKKLHILSHATSQIKFDPHAHLDLEDAYVTLFTLDKRNMIVASENIRATSVAFELTRGWIVGHTAIVSQASLTTQRGDGVINVHVHPTAPIDPLNPNPVSLRTTTGAGRTDVYFVNDKALPHRPIKSVHTSSRSADVHLNYEEAEFSGNVKLDSASYTATGATSYSPKGGEWTHWVGEKTGKDEIGVKSRGWTGLYF